MDIQVHLPAPRRLVQEHGSDALGRQADFVGGDLRDGKGMPEEGRPVAAGFAGEGLLGHVVGFPDQVTALGGILREKGVVHRLSAWYAHPALAGRHGHCSDVRYRSPQSGGSR